MNNSDTIVALASPPGTGALAIIRVSGPETFDTIEKKITDKEKFLTSRPNEIKLYTIFGNDKNDSIDEVTIIKYRAQKSFTGEDMAEIICHGGPVVVERILDALIDTGIRYAKKGEFTRRAFENGKTDIIRAESINQMIQSASVIQQKSAIRNYLGGYTSLVADWKEAVQGILVDVESEIEFNNDDDIAQRESRKIIAERVKIFRESVCSEIKKRERIKEVEKGIQVVIVGPRNAGKSSLFNLILGFERSIVDNRKGTTRDFVSETRSIHNVPVTFIDTAGLAETENSVEKEGVFRTQELIKAATIIMWVTAADENIKDVEKNINNEHQRRVLGIINKIDISEGKEKEEYFLGSAVPYIKISANNKEEKGKVEKFIIQEIAESIDSIKYDCIISNKRQEGIVEDIYKEILAAEKRVDQEEIVSLHCRNILEKIEEYVGKSTTDEVLNRIFDAFCIGK